MESVRIVRNLSRPRGTHSRNLRNRITCAYSHEERAAIEWLNRTPEREELRGVLRKLRGKPRRQIAKELAAAELFILVSLHAETLGKPNRDTCPD